jgi:hypothetical protein
MIATMSACALLAFLSGLYALAARRSVAAGQSAV